VSHADPTRGSPANEAAAVGDAAGGGCAESRRSDATARPAYARRLADLQGARWKRLLDVTTDEFPGSLDAVLGSFDARTSSFPFPRIAGRLFRHNEFVLVAGTG
jgi:hypothetical protein